jgi:DNA glycosylase AlkZ-like
VSWEQVSARRLGRQGLDEPLTGTPAEVVRAMCGAHAQVMSAAELSVGLRLAGVTRADVQRAIWEDRTLVKTRGPRGTVHVLPSADLPMWTGALSALPAFADLMTPAQVDEVVEAIRDALTDGELTTEELTGEIVARTGAWAGDRVMDAFQDKWPRWMKATYTAMWRGAMCFGPLRGRAQTYTGPGRWLPGFRPAEPGQATAELVRHYLRAYGPATPQHFARWLGTPPGWAAERFKSMAAELERVELAGQRMWQLGGDSLPEAMVPGLRLLPYFDAYAVAAQPRELVFAGRAWERALAGGQAGNYPVLLVDGVVAGVWHLRRSGRRATITVEPLTRLTATRRRALDDQVTRVADFLGCTTDLVVGPVSVGPHA